METFAHLSNAELMNQLLASCSDRRRATVRTLLFLAEVHEREMYLQVAASSLWDFCRRFLSMSHGTAYRFATVAAFCKKFPSILEGIESGELHLTTLTQIGPWLKKALDPEALIRETAGKKREVVDQLLAERFGKPQPHVSYGPMMPWDLELQTLIDRARELMIHVVPAHDTLELTKVAYRHLIADAEKRLRGKTDRPRPAPKQPTQNFSRHATREIYARYGEQCAYVDESTGARCPSRAFLQRDHIHLRAHGGSGDAANGRPLCAAHNLFVAKRVLGRDYVERRILARQESRHKQRPVSSATRGASSPKKRRDDGEEPR